MDFAQFFPLLGGDFGVFQTVSRLRGLVNGSLRDPSGAIRLRAEEIIGPTPERDESAETSSIFYFVQNALRYTDDPADIELLKNPVLIDGEIAKQGYFMGDCDDASGYLAALLKAVGYQVQFVIVTPIDSATFDYRHIFVRVWLPRAQAWEAMDATAKIYPLGWEVPNKKERVFDV